MTALPANATWPRELSRSSGFHLFRAIRERLAAFARRRALRGAEAELMALDDQALKDIGLHRSEIRSALLDASSERRGGRSEHRQPLISRRMPLLFLGAAIVLGAGVASHQAQAKGGGPAIRDHRSAPASTWKPCSSECVKPGRHAPFPAPPRKEADRFGDRR